MSKRTLDRDNVLVRMMEVMGEMPGDERRVPLDVKVFEEWRDASVIRQKITFATEPGDRGYAWLLTPESRIGGAPGPAMLALHQTTSIGKDEPAGLGGVPNFAYARELSQRGYIVLAPDYPNFGDYRVDAYALGYASATMKGIWNHTRAIDLLASLPHVDANRIGCIGHSLGGHNTLFLAAFDERVRIAVSSCGFTLFACNRRGGDGPLNDVSDWSHAGYMPRIAERYGSRAENLPFEWDEVLSVIAPRPVFINAPERDAFLVDGVRECVRRVEPLYEKHGAGNALAVMHPACEHDFPMGVRHEAYAFLDRHLSFNLAS
jgi:pimeloyl-ACP methyl ester carboxylesterase